MNETIKKLFEQAGGSIEVDDVTQDEWTYTDNLDVEKFAKLLLSECVNICEKIGTSGDGQYCADAIINRFK
jgi:hypothetical protein